MSDTHPSDGAPEAVIRPLATHDDYSECVRLQRETWGADFSDLVPPSIQMVSQKVGGIAAGAFDADGRLLGFVFGISGVRDERLAHWSDMLAVRPEARGRGLGRRLKLYQRERLLELGVEVMYWTYDPLVARNAHLNINRLGARPTEYVPDMYGETRSPLHGGIGTDRFIVEWELSHPRVERALAGRPGPDPGELAELPIVTREADAASESDRVRVEVPEDIQAVKAESIEAARAWRERTRRAFGHYLGRGYRVTGFYRDAETGRCFYVLGGD